MTINGKAVSSSELWNAETLQRRWNKVEEPTMIKMTINSKAVSQRSWQIWHSYMLNSKTKMYRCRQVEQKEQQKQQWYHHRKWNAISKRRAMRRTCIHDTSASLCLSHAKNMHTWCICLLLALHWYQIGQAEPCDGHLHSLWSTRPPPPVHSQTIPPPNELQLTTTVEHKTNK